MVALVDAIPRFCRYEHWDFTRLARVRKAYNAARRTDHDDGTRVLPAVIVSGLNIQKELQI